MKARELMTQPVVSVRTDASLAEVAKTMVQCRVGCVPVVDEESQLRGMITQTDFAANEHGVPFSTEAVLHMFSHPLSGQEIDKVREERAEGEGQADHDHGGDHGRRGDARRGNRQGHAPIRRRSHSRRSRGHADRASLSPRFPADDRRSPEIRATVLIEAQPRPFSMTDAW